MAPTEILAEQHYRKFSEWLAPLGVRGRLAARRAVGRSERKRRWRRVAPARRRSRSARTRCFRKGVEFARLGLAVVDEQHRFGVQQRLALRRKGAATRSRTS